MSIGIYKITSPSGRVYVGQSIDVDRRFKQYKRLEENSCKGSRKLWYSFMKYGVVNHIFELIEECEILELNNRERHWQEHYDVVKIGLNCRYTASDDKLGIISAESRQRMSDAKKGKPTWTKGIKRTDINRGSCYAARIVLDLATGIYYDCAKDAAEAVGVSYKTLVSYLAGKRKNKTQLIYA